MKTKFSFFALVSRMKNITRWTLMRNKTTENVQEHSHMVAVIAHALALIRRDVFGLESDPGYVASLALFHDSSEIFTGDMPTPIKYFDDEIMKSYKKIESLASRKLLLSLPPELRASYEAVLKVSPDDEAYILVKAADTISAYIKCIEELNAGNDEFKLAAEQSKKKLSKMNLPEVDYFIDNFIPAFSLTLDEIDLSFE